MTSRLFDLEGRVAAVIGGTGVLGGAICHGLAGAGVALELAPHHLRVNAIAPGFFPAEQNRRGRSSVSMAGSAR